ncbi:MAG TPA: hypothetical protein VN376_09650 [Longilinea sp.]|nr:hypothetical protein [Longilinea sp.]
MFTDDHILRQIAQLVAVLKKIAGFKNAGKYHEAYRVIDQSLEDLFSLDAGIIKQLDDTGLASLLKGVYGIDHRKLYFLASLLEAEGDVLAAQQRVPESQQSYQQALDLLYQYSGDAEGDLHAEIATKIDELEQKVTAQNQDMKNLA